ncbi:site-specific integrase [Lactococcus garvieae]
MLNYAVEREYIDKNPISSIKIKRKKDQEENHKQKMDEKFLEREEIDDIITYLKKNKNNLLHARIVEFLWLTGLRYGELQALQWKNYNGTSIEINGTLGINNEKISPKTVVSNRIVDLPQKAKDILKDIKIINELHWGKAEADNYIFLSNRNNPLGTTSFNRILKKAEKECNINKSLSSHIFRHSHVSLLAELNLPLKSIMERVGHSNANTTLKIYNHVTKKLVKKSLKLLITFRTLPLFRPFSI